MPEELNVSYEDPPATTVEVYGPEPINVAPAPAEELTVELTTETLTVELVAPEPFEVSLGEPEVLTLELVEPEPIVVELGGLRGPAGPPGTGGGGAGVFRFHQAAPSTSWVIVHGLGYYPNVAVQDSAGAHVEGDVNYVDETTLTITFSVPFGGYANLS